MVKNPNRGFGLLELLISVALVAVIMMGIYKYWIKSYTNMSETVKMSTLKKKSQIAFNNLINDLKLIGYNPSQITDTTTKRSPFTITSHPSPYNSILFNYYNPDFPACTTAQECRTQYFVDSNNRLIRWYYDETTSNSEPMTILQNVCLLMLYCDPELLSDDATKSCYCNGNFNTNCSDQSASPPPNKMKVVLAVLPNDQFINSFDSACYNSDLDQPNYIRFEKSFKLVNIH